MNDWHFLILAIIFEVIGTTSLKLSNGFSKAIPSAFVVFGYAAAFYFLSRTLNSIPIGIAYAVWSGLGVILISVVGWFWFGDRIDIAGWIGIVLITSGVAVLNLFSKSAPH
jgi:multidrug transporter EmrE-like cation transporter